MISTKLINKKDVWATEWRTILDVYYSYMHKLYISLLILSISFFTFSARAVSAKIIENQNGMVVINQNEVIDDDLIIGAQAVEIDGTVNGDVFVGAQTVKIAGIVNGNIHVGANILDISGVINGSVYAGAQNILISGGTIRGSVLAGASTISMDKKSAIGGSVFAGANMVTINSQVKRSVFVGTGTLIIGSSATIGKDLYYATGEDESGTEISKNAQIVGTVNKANEVAFEGRMNAHRDNKQELANWGAASLFMSLVSFIGALIVGFLFLTHFEKWNTHASYTITQSFWKSMGVGFLVMIAIIPLFFLLMLTFVGMPLAGIVLLLFFLFSYLAHLVSSMTLGRWLSKRFDWKLSPFKTFLLGLAAIYALGMVPVIGFFTGLVAYLAGLGALTSGLFEKKK